MTTHAAEPPVVAYRPSEVVIAASVALGVLVWAIVLSLLTRFGEANAIAIAPGDAVPVKVTPVLDLDSPKLKGKGGQKLKAKMPSMWDKKPPPRPAPEAKPSEKPTAKVSTKAKDDVDDIPDEGTEVVDPDDEKKDDDNQGGGAPSDSTGDLGEGGGSNEVMGNGEGGSVGSPDGTEDDPLKARALGIYRGKLYGHFKSGFSCGDVPEDVKSSCVASATFSIAPDGTVTSVAFSPCGNALVDGPAKAVADSRVGSQIPPPPEKYPEFRPSSQSATYRCP